MDVCSVVGLNVLSIGVDYSTGEAHALTMLYHVLQLILYLQMERSSVISELKPLTAQNKQYNEVVAEKFVRNWIGERKEEPELGNERGTSCLAEEEEQEMEGRGMISSEFNGSIHRCVLPCSRVS